MDIESIAKNVLMGSMTEEQRKVVLEGIKESVKQAKDVQKQRIGENVAIVVAALKKIEEDLRNRYDNLQQKVETRVNSIKDGKDGERGADGHDGRDGKPGRDGKDGRPGRDGKDGALGKDGKDGVSVVNARLDFDNSLVIYLSDGREINVGEIMSPDMAEKIKIVSNGGGTSQSVLDTLTSLQNQINALVKGLAYQGNWNASTNTPTLSSGTGTQGYFYIVSVAGSTNLDGITDWGVNDWAVFNGTAWQKIDNSDLVVSVNGQTGAVTLTTTNISEGTNQYFTNTRARSALSAGTGISYDNSTGVITNSSPDQTVALTAGTGISTSGTYPNFTIANTAPDQTVSLTGSGTTTISGTYPNFTVSSADQYTGTVTSVTGTSPVASSGGNTPAISLASGYGDTQNPYASKTANYFLASPNGSAGVPTFRAIVAADVPTLNQNTTGTASNVTGTVAIGNGGSGQTTAQTAMNAFAGAVTSGSYLRGNGTNVVMSAIQAADVPTLNQNTTGTASNVTGTVAIANGGTGATTAANARTNLGSTTLGSNLFTITNPSAVTFPRFNADNTVSSLDASTFRIAIGAGTGNGTVTSVAQTFTGGLISVSGSPVTTSGTLALTVAGTSGGIPYFSSASTWASSSALTANAVIIGGGAGAAPSTITTGTSGQVLTSNGSGSAPSWQTVSSGSGFSNMDVLTAASGTWTSPAGVTKIKVTIVGSGGGGGAGTSGVNGTGGGAGGTCIKVLTVAASTGYSYVVGAGGSAGGSGNTSSFGPVSGTTYSATGGSAGTSASGTGGAGGVGSNGDLNITGGGGGGASTSNGTRVSGNGGSSFFGSGGFGAGSTGANQTVGNGGNYGGGGGGGCGNIAGGTGGAGVIVIEY